MPYFVGPNRFYTYFQIVELIDLIQNVTLDTAQASRMLRILERTAQRYCARFCDEESYLQSQFKKPGRLHPVLTNELSLFLQDPYDRNL